MRRPDQPDAILGALLRAMTRHSIYSDRLVALALRRPRVRCTAAGVLKRRPPDQWDEEVVAALHLAAGFEPHEDARECRPLLLERLEQLEREDR